MNTAETVLLFAQIIALIGLFGTVIVLAILWYLAGLWGNAVWKRLRRTYHLTVIIYWLERLEKNGFREFQKAEADDLKRHQS